jgi:hypothetical protein
MPHLPSWRRNSEPTGPTQLDELLGDGQERPAVPSEWQPVSMPRLRPSGVRITPHSADPS